MDPVGTSGEELSQLDYVSLFETFLVEEVTRDSVLVTRQCDGFTYATSLDNFERDWNIFSSLNVDGDEGVFSQSENCGRT